MNNRHKYFRNLRYKQKLEAGYNQRHGRYTNVYFVTQEPDPRYIREYGYRYPYSCWSAYNKYRGHDFYLTWKRPEVPYSILEYQHGRNGWKQLMKQQTSRRNRRIKITEDDASWREKSFYKKYEDRWNYD
jgi:hypothetical protein